MNYLDAIAARRNGLTLFSHKSKWGVDERTGAIDTRGYLFAPKPDRHENPVFDRIGNVSKAVSRATASDFGVTYVDPRVTNPAPTREELEKAALHAKTIKAVKRAYRDGLRLCGPVHPSFKNGRGPALRKKQREEGLLYCLPRQWSPAIKHRIRLNTDEQATKGKICFVDDPTVDNGRGVAPSCNPPTRPAIYISETELIARYGPRCRAILSRSDFPAPVQFNANDEAHHWDLPGETYWHRPVLASWERPRTVVSRSKIEARVAAEIAREKRARVFVCRNHELPSNDLDRDQSAERRGFPRPRMTARDWLTPVVGHRSDSVQDRPKPGIEFLDRVEEAELIRRAQAGDGAALNRLVENFQPLVEKIAKRYGSGRNETEDLVAEVNVSGAIQECVLNKFNLAQGKRLAIFLHEPIRWAILAYLRKQKKEPLSSTVDLSKKKTQESETTDKNDERGVENLNVDSADGGDAWNETFLSEDDETVALEKLSAMLARLTERERFVIEGHHGLNGKGARTLAEIAQDLKVSAERARQIETAAFARAGLGTRP